MPTFKIVVADYPYPTLDIFRNAAGAIGAEVVDGQCRSEADVVEIARDADALMNFHVRASRSVIERLPRCRVIVRVGIGYDAVDVEAATERGVFVCNVPDYCVDEVADHALALMLACARKLFIYDRALRDRQWDYPSGTPVRRLRGQTLGLAAFGKVARSLSVKAKAMGMRVLAFDPYLHNDVLSAFGVERRTGLLEMLAESDFVSAHTPLTAETAGLFGERAFGAMKPGAFFINTSRGPVVNEPALVSALREGRIAGAGLDVYKTEPLLPDHPLLSFPNVILTPHIAWYSEESLAAVQEEAIASAIQALQGQRPSHLVNPMVYAHRPELPR
ncbi:MAG: C-terminal binding protein [Armatimonadetes bacterium]|nr:C-terminal binding protein [Armatimonadota bacterium]